MKAAIRKAILKGDDQAMVDFQDIWKLDATKEEGNEFEKKITAEFRKLGFDIHWTCDVFKGPELMYIRW